MRVPTTLERLHESLDYHSARHDLLTANLAHVDTPGYRPLDLERTSPFRTELSVALRATNPAHFGVAQATPPGRVVFDPTATSADGNGVSLDREAVKIATNTIRYDLVSALTSHELGLWSWAANDGRNG
jgi:flagellar basal-body rod protein FlgB